ncbi:hypothetical protein Hdeb2414_s0016g00474461 [Helianthus debilis subsp. tardiflorus]
MSPGLVRAGVMIEFCHQPPNHLYDVSIISCLRFVHCEFIFVFSFHILGKCY